MNDDNSTTQDPAAIERDIRRTQDDMSRTVDKIGDQLTPRNIFNSLLDKADANNVDARMLFDGARRNPVALGLIAAGTIWLISDKDSKIPSMPKFGSKDGDAKGFDTRDASHRDYVSHMSAIEMRDGEEVSAYQRRRDQHRANFMMVEQNHGEDEHGFRERLDSITEKFRDKRQAWSDSSAKAGTATREASRQKARMAAGKTQEFYSNNPLVGGFLAIAAGAALGSGLPITRQEQDKLGAVGGKARDMVSEQSDQLSSKFQEKKDELVEQADQKLQQAGSDQQQQGQQQQPQAQQPQAQQQQFAGTDQPAPQQSPFNPS